MALSLRWQQYFMRMAEVASTGSKDGSSQVGAVLVRSDKTVASVGFNGFPRRIQDVDHFLSNPDYRAEKYMRIVHAEENCLNHCRDHDTDGFSLFVTYHPCDRCALRIASTGVTTVYFRSMADYETRWADKITNARIICDEAGIELIRVDPI